MNIKKEKRGQVRRELVLWIIALFVLLVFGFFVYYLNVKVPSLENKETCKNSVVLRAQWFSKAAEAVYLPRPELKCKTEKILIKTSNEEKIKERIANAMYDCWDMLGRGKMDFLGLRSKNLVVPASQCVVCSVIEFNKNVKEKFDRIEGFAQFLQEKKVDNLNITYLEFFKNEKGAIYDVKNELETYIYPKDKYAVVFMGLKKISSVSEFLNTLPISLGVSYVSYLITGGSTVVASVASASYPYIYNYLTSCEKSGCAIMMLIPYKKEALEEACDIILSKP